MLVDEAKTGLIDSRNMLIVATIFPKLNCNGLRLIG